MSFTTNLLKIQVDLSNHKRDKNLLMEHYISERLNLARDVYEAELSKTLSYLTRREEINLISKINRRNNDGKSESN